MHRRKILILAANPTNTSQLSLDNEVREIEAGLRRSRYRDQFELIAQWAVRPDDLRRALLDHEPQIVHFSGHGASEDGLVLENQTGQMQLVNTAALSRLFQFFQKTVRCVLLNACYSEVQAVAIHEHIDYVIGMNRPIGDRAAIEFAVGFYDALGAGRTVPEAFELGCIALDLESISESATPKLKARAGKTDLVLHPPDSTLNQSASTPMTPSHPTQSNPAQSISNTISIGGSVSGSNLFNFSQAQATDSARIDQGQNTSPAASALQAALVAVQQLQQEIQATATLNPVQKTMVQAPAQMLEAELQKPQPDKNLIQQTVEALKQGVQGVETLAEPVMRVAALVAKAMIGSGF